MSEFKIIRANLVGNINDPERDTAIKAQDWKKVDELVKIRTESEFKQIS